MKFGKEFQHLLDASDFPDDWKTSAIEYRKLKKLIKNVVAELQGMGLSPNVLHKLLVTETDPATGQRRRRTDSPSPIRSNSNGSASDADADAEDVFEFEFEVDDNSPTVAADRRLSPKEVLVDLVLKADGDDVASIVGAPASLHHPAPGHHRFRLRMVNGSGVNGADDSWHGSGSGSVSAASRDQSPPTNGMANGMADGMTNGASFPRPASVADMIRSHSGTTSPTLPSPFRPDSPASSFTTTATTEHLGRGRVMKRAVTDHGGVTAEYVLTGDEANPVPQLRLHVLHTEPVVGTSCTPQSSLPDVEFSDSDSMLLADTPTDTDDEDATGGGGAGYFGLVRNGHHHHHHPAPPTEARLRRPGADKTPVLPPSPSLLRLQSVASPIWAIASGANTDGMRELSLGDAAEETEEEDEDEDEIDLLTPRMPAARLPLQPATLIALDDNMAGHTPSSTAHGVPLPPVPHLPNGISPDPAVIEPDREFIIPLQSDMAFFEVLTAALKSLSAFHKVQQELFRIAVRDLCAMISNSIVPSEGGVIVLPTPPNTAPINSQAITKYEAKAASPSQKDLYAWREIFSLWVESQIFESNAERDRGERTVDEAERRLKVFANEVVKRGLGDRRSIKGRKTRKAWEEFLRLNVLLLDLKRFQMANIDAARKILKKHDKRTALTASTGLAAFVRSTLTAHVDVQGNVNTWTFYNTSLPHVLLASLTDTLLPILPSLDDYACLICLSIAFKPIRLSCSHLFCVRCLVKMQQRSKDSCPLCRSPSVLLADKTSLDVALMNFMKDWFPREVREKQRDNTNEIAREQMQDAGLDTRCVVM